MVYQISKTNKGKNPPQKTLLEKEKEENKKEKRKREATLLKIYHR